jgi:hypothetical protein
VVAVKIKIKKANKDGIVRLESSGQVKEVLINEDFMNPKGESIAVCFKGESTSGIVEFSPAEFDMLQRSLKSRMHLIRGMKVLNP